MMAKVRIARAVERLREASKEVWVAASNVAMVAFSWVFDCTVVMAERRSWAKAADSAKASCDNLESFRTRLP